MILPTIERFMNFVIPEPNSGCWLWIGADNGEGYGRIRLDGKSCGAHRISYELFIGEIPIIEGSHGMCVLHKCDVRCCVNPGHLFLGTNQDNVDDMISKGRKAVLTNEDHGSTKLSNNEVNEIRFLLNHSALSQRKIADKFNVNQSQICRINTHQQRIF